MIRFLTLVLASAALLVGCGDGATTTSMTTSETTTMATSFTAELTFTARADSDAKPRVFHLNCPADSEAEQPRCDLLAEDPGMFAEVSRDLACIELYGGPDTIEVEGTIDGSPVKTTLSRINGCEIERWQKSQPVHGIEPVTGSQLTP